MFSFLGVFSGSMEGFGSFTGGSIDDSSPQTERAAIECLESRQLFSADLIDFGAIVSAGLTSSAVDLGSFHVKSKASAKGAVGITAADLAYKVTVTEPVNLNLKLSKLKQQDELQVLFADGTPINAGWTNGKSSSIKAVQRLDPGVYYVNVSHGRKFAPDGTPLFGAKIKKYKIKATDGFSLSVSAGKPDQTVLPPEQPVVQKRFSSAFGGTGAGGANTQPRISTELAADSGFFRYEDFSGSPLWSADGPLADDVIQGSVGDCYFMSTISSIARNNPGLIAQTIVPQSNDEFAVHFQWNGQEYVQQVDASLPVDQGGNLIFARQPDSGAIWPAILEKAFCFFRPSSNDPGSYDGIAGGLPSEPLKGFGSTDAVDINMTQFRTAPQFLEYLVTLQQQGFTAYLGTIQPRGWVGENPLPSGLYTGHEYSVVSVDTAANTIELRNPWATNSHSGPDGSGGYITISGDLALQSVDALSYGTTTLVTTTIDPTPDPEPTPDPSITDGIPERLGDHSYQTDQGVNYDVFTLVATESGEAAILVNSTAFRPQLLVAEVGDDGGLNSIADDSNVNDLDQAFVRFYVVAGMTYEFGVFVGGGSDTGAYRVQFTSNLSNLTQLSPATGVSDGTGSLTGLVYEDENANGYYDSSESGSSNWTVYLDYDNDGVLDTDEPSTLTDDNGEYVFTSLPPDTYTVRVVGEEGWTQTQPLGVNYGWYAIVSSDENTEVTPFGMAFSTASLTGIVYYDANANAFQDFLETGLQDYIVYLDLGSNGVYNSGDPYTYTDENGFYSFDGLQPGTYVVRMYRPSNATWSITEGSSGWAPEAVAGTDVNGGSFGIV